MSLQTTPRADRLHIGIFGKRNSGKSSLLNAICGQQVSMVSSYAGTTTDPVYKAMELPGLGPVVFMDTAGFDDEGELGKLRVEKTRNVLDMCDLAILVFHEKDIRQELCWYRELTERRIPVLCVYHPMQQEKDRSFLMRLRQQISTEVIEVDAKKEGIREEIRKQLLACLPAEKETDSICGHLVKRGDVVLLVMPQDMQAPKGRLILPQVQTIRDLLEQHCVIQCCTLEEMDISLRALAQPPQLIISDSQVFAQVYEKKPKDSLLTSFSVLLARYKGDIAYFIEGAKRLEHLKETDRVLIAEACTHAPLSEDIGRVKLPAMLRKKVGAGLRIDIVSGNDFPEDISEYALIIHCGACMFHRRHVLSRIEKAKTAKVAMTNYGIAIAFVKGILDKVVY